MIVSKYIGKKYLFFLFFSLLFFISIYIIVDFAEHVSRFIRQHKTFMDIVKYYYNEIPLIITIMFPVSGMLASFFSYGRMNQFKEILILRTSGISDISILKPIMIISFIFMIVFFVFNNYIATTSTVSYYEMYRGLSKKSFRIKTKSNFGYNGENGIIYYISFLDSKRGKMGRGSIVVNRKDLSDIVVFNSAYYDTLNRYWVFYNGYRIKEDSSYSFLELPLSIATDKPEDMAKDRLPLEGMKLNDLFSLKKRMKRSGMSVDRIESEITDRFVYPFMFLFLSILGGILAIRGRETGMAKGFGLCIIIAFLYWGMNQVFKSYAQTGFYPVFGVMFPHLIALVFVVYNILKLDR